MRTTLTLDDDVADALHRRARQERRSFKDVVNQTLRQGLQTGARVAASDRKPFEVQPEACGFLPGIDPLRLNHLFDQLETDRFVIGHAKDTGRT